jgi:hypothetical protein
MANPDKKIKELLAAIERVRKSLEGTRAHVPTDTSGYVWTQIGRAVSELEKIERDMKAVRLGVIERN